MKGMKLIKKDSIYEYTIDNLCHEKCIFSSYIHALCFDSLVILILVDGEKNKKIGIYELS